MGFSLKFERAVYCNCKQKKTIQSIKEKIPNYKIMIVECTNFTEEEKSYFENECDYVLNLWDKKELHYIWMLL